MNRPLIVSVAVIALIAIALAFWFLRSPDTGDSGSGAPQTPTALGADELADAFDAATSAVREAMRKPPFADSGTPRAVEGAGLTSKKDEQGNWYGKLWTANGTGMTGDGGAFTWKVEVINENGRWSAVAPAEVKLGS